MNNYQQNELEDIEHPYELEYSSHKSSKNESLKIQTNKDNNNSLGINNNNNYPSINNNTLFQNNSNIINIQNNDNILQRNNNNKNNISNINNNVNYNYNNNNYRLNDNNKRRIENIIENTNNANHINFIKRVIIQCSAKETDIIVRSPPQTIVLYLAIGELRIFVNHGANNYSA